MSEWEMPDVAALSTSYGRRLETLARASDKLKQRVEGAVERLDHRHVDRVSFRVKSLASFIGKAEAAHAAEAPYGNPPKEIEDQIGGRVIVFFLHDVRLVIDELLRTFNELEERHKRPASVAEFGYEGEHLLCIILPDVRSSMWSDDATMPEVFEIQVRTVFQHAWAEPNHDVGYKPGAPLSDDQQRTMYWVAASAWGADRQFERLWSEIENNDKDMPTGP